jgi:hypothetical protein
MKILFFMLLCAATCFAQSTSKMIFGTVKDIQNEMVIGASIELLRVQDSAHVHGTVSNELGKFSFAIDKSGMYFLKVSGLSYKEYSSVPFRVDSQKRAINLPTIYLLGDKETTLETVTVTARKSLIVVQIDRTVINVDAMLSATTSNTQEVLERTPGVQIDAQGNISLNGKTGVQVLIDGRSTYLSGTDLTAYLKSLPGGVLEKLELMENPPAKYEASGGAIINIILKKNRTVGFTGNAALAYSLGKLSRSGNSLNLNYRKGKINIFGNIGYNHEQHFVDQIFERKLYAENGSLSSQVVGDNYSQNKSNGFNTRIGFDFNTSDNTIIGFQIFAQQRPNTEWAEYNTQSRDVQNNTFRGSNNLSADWKSQGANLNFNHKINTNGHELSADFNYIHYASAASKHFNNDVSDISLQQFDNDIAGKINIYNFKADYTYPFANGIKLDAGVKTSFVNNDNDANFYTIKNEQATQNFGRSNHFIYNENLNAAYINLQKPITKKLNLSAGLRAENTNLLGDLKPNVEIKGEKFTQNFTNVFPSIFLNYKFGKDSKHSLGANYSKRINRPNYQQFNPFLNYVDAYTYTQGNTEAKPFFLGNYRLQYAYSHLYRLALGYTTADGILGDITIRRDDIFIRKPYNVGTGFQLMFSQNLSLKPANFWNVNINYTLARFEVDGMADGATGEAKFNASRLNISNQFVMKKDWSCDLSMNYSSGDNFFPVATLGKLQFYISIQKKILKNKGSLRLSLDDMSYGGNTRERITNFQNTYQYREIKYDSRRVGLALTYNFGNEKYARKRRHQDNAAQEEQGRVL